MIRANFLIVNFKVYMVKLGYNKITNTSLEDKLYIVKGLNILQAAMYY